MAARRSSRAVSFVVLVIALVIAGVSLAAGTGFFGINLLSGITAPGSTPAPSLPASKPASTGPAKPTPTVTASAITPVDLGCERILSLQDVYDYNPNFSLDTGAVAGAESAALRAVGGKACQWVNLTSGERFVVAVATPDAATLTAVRALASAGQAASALGKDAYLAKTGGMNVVTMFIGKYWIVLGSATLSSAEDFAKLADRVRTNLK